MVKQSTKSRRLANAIGAQRQFSDRPRLDHELRLANDEKPVGRPDELGVDGHDDDDDDDGRRIVDAEQIFKQARKQLAEEQLLPFGDEKKSSGSGTKRKRFDLAVGQDDSSDSDECEAERSRKVGERDIDELDVDVPELDADEQAIMATFLSDRPAEQRDLAAIIRDKLEEKRDELAENTSLSGTNFKPLEPRVEQMYRDIKQVLKRYRSGKLPKPFKIIPRLTNWEQVVSLLEPAEWSAAAMYQATRTFASGLDERRAQRFYNLVLLPRLRDDIAEYKRLNFHLYQAVKKAIFKPAAFFKGIVLPLCDGGDCTLREAIIISSVLQKCSIPMLHSAAAILKLADMDYSPANSVFMRVLIGKKYALPYRVLDAVVDHLVRFLSEKRRLPVLWHQCFLTFVEIYKADLAAEQKEALLDVARAHSHHEITPEIRHELLNSAARRDNTADMDCSKS